MKKIVFIVVGMLVLISGLVLMWYAYESNDIRLLPTSYKKKDTFYENVRIKLMTNFGSDAYARLKIAIPCKDKKQHSDISNKTAKIKSALITTIDGKEFSGLIARRDFKTIKQIYLSVINRFTDKPVDTIYFESFNY